MTTEPVEWPVRRQVNCRLPRIIDYLRTAERGPRDLERESAFAWRQGHYVIGAAHGDAVFDAFKILPWGCSVNQISRFCWLSFYESL